MGDRPHRSLRRDTSDSGLHRARHQGDRTAARSGRAPPGRPGVHFPRSAPTAAGRAGGGSAASGQGGRTDRSRGAGAPRRTRGLRGCEPRRALRRTSRAAVGHWLRAESHDGACHARHPPLRHGRCRAAAARRLPFGVCASFRRRAHPPPGRPPAAGAEQEGHAAGERRRDRRGGQPGRCPGPGPVRGGEPARVLDRPARLQHVSVRRETLGHDARGVPCGLPRARVVRGSCQRAQGRGPVHWRFGAPRWRRRRRSGDSCLWPPVSA